MLVLTRKPGESIQIADSITLTVQRISGNRVRLSFEAPSHVDIKRSEIVSQSDTVECAEASDTKRRQRQRDVATQTA